MSSYADYGLTPEQYHAGLAKLWAALGLVGVQEQDVFTLASECIIVGKTKELVRNAEKRVCTKVWEVVNDHQRRFPDSLILGDLVSDLEDELAYGPEEKGEG